MKKNINHGYTIGGMVKALPVFKGYTVDVRLGQFRKSSPETAEIEFIDFSPPQGDDLLEEYLGTLDENSPECRELAAYFLGRG